MITIKNVSKTFQDVQALREVTLAVEKGSLCGLLGANGAGKSTLFKIVMGLLQADSGEIAIAGSRVRFGDTDYKSRIGYAPETPTLYDYLTGVEFLHFIAAAKSIPVTERAPAIQKWLDFFELTPKADELILGYSHGMRRKISLSTALLGSPTILLLDEATNGLDPQSSFHLKAYLRDFCGAGGTVLFSSHIIETVEQLCDRLVILHRGRVLTVLQRADWQAFRDKGSSLEQEFMALLHAAETTPVK